MYPIRLFFSPKKCHSSRILGKLFCFSLNLFFQKMSNTWEYIFLQIILVWKGVFSKPSGDCIVAPNLCFFRYSPQILAPATFFLDRKNGGVGFYLTWHFEPKNSIFQVICRYHYSKIFGSWDKCMKFWLQPWF